MEQQNKKPITLGSLFDGSGVILMDANGENGDMVAGRILECFYQLYTNGKVKIEYGIARMDS